jgi:ABC-type amino acid transport substrate-binding protein
VKRSYVAAAAASLAFAFAAHAQTLADVKKRGTLRLGYSETSVPFSFKSPEGPPAGYSVELCQRIAADVATKAGSAVKVEWVPLTPATRLDAVASGKVDLECGTTTITLGRREKVEFSLPIFVDAATVMSRKSAAIVARRPAGEEGRGRGGNDDTSGARARAVASASSRPRS